MEITQAIREAVEREISKGNWSQDDFKNFLADFDVEKVEDIDWRIEEVREKLMGKYMLFIAEIFPFEEWKYEGKKYYLVGTAQPAGRRGDHYIYRAHVEDDERNVWEVEWNTYPIDELGGCLKMRFAIGITRSESHFWRNGRVKK